MATQNPPTVATPTAVTSSKAATKTVDSLKIPGQSKKIKNELAAVDVNQWSNFVSVDWLSEIADFTKEVDFDTFGKMNSAAYRKLFFRLAASAKLTAEATSFVLLLMTLIKNKARIINAMADEEITKNSEMAKMALNFISQTCVQYVNDEKRQISKNFPIVKGPESFSSLSVLYASMFNKDIRAHWLIYQSYFANQNLSAFLQDLNEMAMRFQWTQLITNTKNESQKRPKDRKVGTFYREIYKNQVSDKHDFLSVAGEVYLFKGTSNKAETVEEVIQYVRDCSLSKKMDIMPFIFIHAEWRMFHPAFDENGNQLFDYDPTGNRDPNTVNGLLAKLIQRSDPTTFVYTSELIIPIPVV